MFARLMCLWLMLMFSFFSGLAQINPDSLKSIDISKLSSKNRILVLNQIIRLSVNEPDSIIKYANQLLEFTKENNMPRYQANLHLGQAYKIKGNYQRSIEYLFEALRIAEIVDNNLAASVKTVLGSVFGRIGDIDKLSYYFQQGIRDFSGGDNFHDSLRIMVTYNNYAEAYYNNQYYDSAYKYYEKALHWALILDRVYESHFILGNQGMVNLKLGRADTAEVQLLSVIDYLSRYNDMASLLTFKTHLAEVYIEKKAYEQAENTLNECLSIALDLDLKEQIRDCYQRLSQLYEQTGNFHSSLFHYRKYIAFRDSIKNVETIRKIGDLRTEFEVGQKQAEVDLLTVEKRNQRIILFSTAAFALVLIILAAIIYKYYRSKSRISKVLAVQKQELERLNHTKDKFFSIISHDLRGPVSSFHGISRMIKYLVTTKETNQLLEIADDIDQSVDRLSSLLDNLLTWAMQQQGHFPNVPEKLHVPELAEDLVQTLGNMAGGKNIKLTEKVDQELAIWADRNMTMTILRNLVNNALKFTPEGGSVAISATEKGDFAEISVSDTGVGIPQEKLDRLFTLQDKKSTYGTSGEKGLGLGLQLVYEFIELNGGKIAVESEEGGGTVFKVVLPLFESVKVEV